MKSDPPKIESGDIGLATGVFGISALIVQSEASIYIKIVSGICIIASFIAIQQLVWVFILPRIPITMEAYEKYRNKRGNRFKLDANPWLIFYYPPLAMKVLFYIEKRNREQTEFSLLTILATVFVLGITTGIWTWETLISAMS